jgi:hypothetical protein
VSKKKNNEKNSLKLRRKSKSRGVVAQEMQYKQAKHIKKRREREEEKELIWDNNF